MTPCRVNSVPITHHARRLDPQRLQGVTGHRQRLVVQGRPDGAVHAVDFRGRRLRPRPGVDLRVQLAAVDAAAVLERQGLDVADLDMGNTRFCGGVS